MVSRSARRHRAQAGTTLIELLVSMMIIGIVLVLLVGAFSTSLLDATLTKRNTAVSAVVEYELEKIGAAAFSATPAPYSECFAVDNVAKPVSIAFKGTCPSGTDLRVDVTETDVHVGLQRWAVQAVTYPSLGVVGSAVSVYKANR
jgi:prepilin-type N-terminal cleavage/methylation domain-containing protein